jgi:Zn finger protein HypA/HybF involved in hydrogenase expression
VDASEAVTHVKHGYSEKPMVAGETVTPGRYVCLKCGHEHEVKKGIVNLPVCPRCQSDTWRIR